MGSAIRIAILVIGGLTFTIYLVAIRAVPEGFVDGAAFLFVTQSGGSIFSVAGDLTPLRADDEIVVRRLLPQLLKRSAFLAHALSSRSAQHRFALIVFLATFDDEGCWCC